MSGTMTSTPSVAASGNIIPQSTTTASSPYSMTMRFIPISPKPPRGMMRRVARSRGCAVSKWLIEIQCRETTKPRDRETSWINPIQHSRIRNRLAQMRRARHPRHNALDSHSEARVRKCPVLADVEIPLKAVDGQVVLFQTLKKKVVIVDALRSADDLTVALRRDHVERQRQRRILRVGLHVKQIGRASCRERGEIAVVACG